MNQIPFREKLIADKPGSPCCHLVQILLSYSLLSNNLKIKIGRTMRAIPKSTSDWLVKKIQNR
jgi:hypothetical protein